MCRWFNSAPGHHPLRLKINVLHDQSHPSSAHFHGRFVRSRTSVFRQLRCGSIRFYATRLRHETRIGNDKKIDSGPGSHLSIYRADSHPRRRRTYLFYNVFIEQNDTRRVFSVSGAPGPSLKSQLQQFGVPSISGRCGRFHIRQEAAASPKGMSGYLSACAVSIWLSYGCPGCCPSTGFISYNFSAHF